jgi:catechol 2,3-dioxygenase-like lactoylglutathione lyase family enzyme
MQPLLTHLALHVRDLDACIEFYHHFCGMQVVHERTNGDWRVVWMAEPGKEHDFIFVMVPGGPGRDQTPHDYSHFGFALESRDAVDAMAEKARSAGFLVWEPRQEPYPVGYYCGVRDPDGNMVEFSYGQPLGPGAHDEAMEDPMPRVHDRGGWPDAGSIDRDEHDLSMWEKRTDALMRVLRSKHYMQVDEMRRATEGIELRRYEQLTYYERWAEAMEVLMIEKGVLTQEEIDRKVADLDA